MPAQSFQAIENARRAGPWSAVAWRRFPIRLRTTPDTLALMSRSRLPLLALPLAFAGAWFYVHPGAPSPRVRIAVSVDWEGDDLTDENLAAVRRFGATFPDIPLTHFLNAAYFTKAGVDARDAEGRMRSVLRPIDETGLHVHCWKSLVETAGVRFRAGPRFWGVRYPPGESHGDRGHDVELAAYDVAEVAAILRKSRAILQARGFALSAAFRAGGWMGSPGVLQAARTEGFRIDSSATDTFWHDEIAGLPLVDRIRALWPQVTQDTQPFLVETPAGAILEMPDTGALADYVTAQEMRDHVARALARLPAAGGKDLFVHLGFHQETAAQHIARVIEAIRAIRADPQAPVVFETLTRSAAQTGLDEDRR